MKAAAKSSADPTVHSHRQAHDGLMIRRFPWLSLFALASLPFMRSSRTPPAAVPKNPVAAMTDPKT